MTTTKGADGPQRGDVLSVGYADPDRVSALAQYQAEGQRLDLLLAPNQDEPVAVRLHDYPFAFVVRVARGRTGPAVTALAMSADDGATVDYVALRSVPLRRIALTAWRFLLGHGGVIGSPGDNALRDARPDHPDADRLVELVWRIEAAIADGQPVRRTVADEMHLSTATVDRLIRTAKDLGELDGITIPRRPGVRQRDARPAPATHAPATTTTTEDDHR